MSKYITCGKDVINVEGLLNEVNKFDKDFGVKLKHPNIWREPENYVEIMYSNININIGALICIVNGIEVDDWFETGEISGFGAVCKAVKMNDEEFSYFSLLNWDGPDVKYENTDLLFRCRFISLVLSQLIGRTKNIIERMMKEKYHYKHSQSEKAITIGKKYISDVVQFVRLMIHPRAYFQNMILLIHEYVSFGRKNVEHMKLRNLLNGHMINTREGVKKDFFTKRYLSDDLVIYNVLKMSYMIATNKTNVEVIPKFKHIEGATVKHDLMLLVEELGIQIIRNTKKKYAPMFRAYLEASPLIYNFYGRDCTDNYAIRIGLIAIDYCKFICDDENLQKLISEMVKRGI